MHKKYSRGLEHPLEYNKQTAMSSIWRRLKEIGNIAESNIGFLIHKGNSSFFHDCWNLSHKLNDSFEWTLYPTMSFQAVHSLPTQDPLRIDIINRLSAEDFLLFSQTILDSDDDQIYWKGTASGSFKFSAAFEEVRQKQPHVPSRAYIWSSRIPLKISVFLWRLIHSWIPSQDILKKIRISLASKCIFCDTEETINHLFINCKFASDIWSFFENILCVFPRQRHTVQSKLESWWNLNLSAADHEVYNLLACLIFWEIWKSRNSHLYDGIHISAPKACDRILFSIRSISAAKPFSVISLPLQRILHLHIRATKPRFYRFFSWCPPPENRVKLNVDGSSLGNPGHSGGGGLIRNFAGQPLFGYSSYYGKSTTLSAECEALRDGVLLCIQHGYSSVDVETDSLLLYQMLMGSDRCRANAIIKTYF